MTNKIELKLTLGRTPAKVHLFKGDNGPFSQFIKDKYYGCTIKISSTSSTRVC